MYWDIMLEIITETLSGGIYNDANHNLYAIQLHQFIIILSITLFVEIPVGPIVKQTVLKEGP